MMGGGHHLRMCNSACGQRVIQYEIIGCRADRKCPLHERGDGRGGNSKSAAVPLKLGKGSGCAFGN